MSQNELEGQVLKLLQNFNGDEPLKELFWSKLNYDRQNKPIGRRAWPEAAASVLAADPVLLAASGQDGDFHILYCRLAKDRLSLADERIVTSRLLKDHPYSLFVFSNKEQLQWHILNVKHETNVEERRLYRRLAVGPAERMRTAAEVISRLDHALLTKGPSKPSPLAIQAQHDLAFDVEPVQRDFFRTFADVYHRVSQDIASVKDMATDSGRLAQLLLDRMLFLYFIQKKGWLNQEQDYLFNKFRRHFQAKPSGDSFYTEVLLPLFQCLSEDGTALTQVGSVPFLNGGLFERDNKKTQAERRRIGDARISIQNSTFKVVFESLLERFNFTVTEDTPLDVEVAIDPEMLGKIFESLILQLEKDPTKDIRKMTGSYYTPRAIVHFICQQALHRFLTNCLLSSSDQAPEQKAAERITALLDPLPASQMSVEDFAELRKLFTKVEASHLRTSLLGCRICDPAVGSGAFPVGVLLEIVNVLAKLDLILSGKEVILKRNYDYDLKKQVIESCLYGVDVQEQAVRLCELRLWLSLVVDYQLDQTLPFQEAIRHIPALPNLSYRIVRGDSLLERLFGSLVALDTMAKDARTKRLIESIQADKTSYFREAHADDKRRLELRILAKQADLAEQLVEAKKATLPKVNLTLFGESAKDKKQRELREHKERELDALQMRIHQTREHLEELSKSNGPMRGSDLDRSRRLYFETGDAPTFMWRVDFAEVFAQGNGFDIVFGNPPYAGFQTLTKDYKADLSHVYSCASGRFDFYMPFVQRGLEIVNEKGHLVYICPSTFLKRDGGQGLRQVVRMKYGIERMVDFGHQRIFEEALNYTGIYFFSHSQPEKVRVQPARYVDQSLKFRDSYFDVSDIPNDGEIWFLPTGPAYRLWMRLKAGEFVTLGESFEISEGVVTGKNEVFLVEALQAKSMNLEHNLIAPCLRGSEIYPFVHDDPGDVLIYPYDRKTGKVIAEADFKASFPNGYEYLRSRRQELAGRGYFDRSGKKWFELWNQRNVENLFCSKIVVSELGDRNSFAMCNGKLVYGDTACGLVPRSKTVNVEATVALMNSAVAEYYFRQLSVPKANGFVVYKPLYLKKLPLPPLDMKTSQELAELASLLRKHSEGSDEALKRIDAIAYQVYGLTGSDIGEIREELAASPLANRYAS